MGIAGRQAAPVPGLAQEVKFVDAAWLPRVADRVGVRDDAPWPAAKSATV